MVNLNNGLLVRIDKNSLNTFDANNISVIETVLDELDASDTRPSSSRPPLSIGKPLFQLFNSKVKSTKLYQSPASYVFRSNDLERRKSPPICKNGIPCDNNTID